jgi:RNA polymerase sigma factor (sigma-70 family)
MTIRELECLAREHRRTLLAYARRGANSHHDAEDAVQDALTITVAIRERIRPEAAVAYIGTTAHHVALHLTRQANRTSSLDEPTSEAASRHELIADARTADPDGRLDLLAGLRALKRDEARALAARMLGYSYREIADGFGWSHTKTNRCVKEGRARLRALLAADIPSPAPPSGEGDGDARSPQQRHTLRALRPSPERRCDEDAA